jgi:hypothetical protein
VANAGGGGAGGGAIALIANATLSSFVDISGTIRVNGNTGAGSGMARLGCSCFRRSAQRTVFAICAVFQAALEAVAVALEDRWPSKATSFAARA